MSFEEILRKNMNGFDENAKSRNVVIDTFSKQTGWDGGSEISVLQKGGRKNNGRNWN